MTKDRDTAIKILKALAEKGDVAKIKDVFRSVPRSWQQKIVKGLELAEEPGVAQLLEG